MLVEMFSLQYCVLLISLLKYRTEKEDAFSFILYHIIGSQKGKWWLSCLGAANYKSKFLPLVSADGFQ